MRTEGTVELKLFTETHETTHTFHVVGRDSEMHYAQFWVSIFLEERESVINYCSRQLVRNEVIVNFDPKTRAIKTEPCRRTLMARTENVVSVPTTSKGLGLLPKNELLPGVYIASSLTRAINGICVTSIINTTEADQTVVLPWVKMGDLDESESALTLTLSAVVGNVSRLSSLHNQLRLDHLDSEERASIVTICEEYNNIFHLPGDKLTFTSTIEHVIPTLTIDPHRAINVKAYRLPEVHKDEVQRHTEQMLADGVIQHSTSPWNSPVVVVPKKIGASGKMKWRVVVDFHKLNDVTIGDSFPIPVISDVLNSLGNSKYFSTVDCASGFWQIPVRVEDQPKTALNTNYGHFEYTSIPFGLKGAPATFQRLMSTMLSGMEGLKCLVYLDDIIVFGETLRVHNDKLGCIC